MDGSSQPPVNARWKDCLPAFERAFGKVRAELFLGRLIPLSYAGEVLVLGAPSAWHRDWVTRHFGERVQKILGGPIRVEVSDIARAAEARLRAAGPS